MTDHKDFLKEFPWCGGNTKLGRVKASRRKTPNRLGINWFEKEDSNLKRSFMFTGTHLGYTFIAQRCTVCFKTTLLEKEN